MGCLSSVSFGHVPTIWPGWAGYTGMWGPANQTRVQKPTIRLGLGLVAVDSDLGTMTNIYAKQQHQDWIDLKMARLSV